MHLHTQEEQQVPVLILERFPDETLSSVVVYLAITSPLR